MTYDNFHVDIDESGVATVLMDRRGESMNTLGVELLQELDTVIDRLEADDVRAVVLGSAKKDFLAGADIRMFADFKTPDDAITGLQEIHRIFNRIEALSAEAGKPVVMAIHGACLGGGLELALTGSMRVCTSSAKTQLGQPEVQLGLIPGAGGTQRLPALVGLAAGLEMVVGGRPARHRKARKIGLVDEVVPPEVLLEVAKRRAIEAIDAAPSDRVIALNVSTSNLQRLALEKNPAGRKVLFKKAWDTMMKETKGHYPAPKRAIEAVQIGVDQGREAGVAAEIRFFAELVFTTESHALRSIFFATQELKADTGVDSRARAKDVDRVAVLGGGLMGGGIAAVTGINAGKNVRIKEVDNAGVGRGLAHANKLIAKRAKRRRMSDFEVDQVRYRFTGSTTWDGFENTDLVIEAVFENLELKQSLLKEVEAMTDDDTIFASNTSSIPIADIAAASSRPHTVVGMHYFSPVEKMPLLEVIVTDDTADWVTATAVQVGKEQGKTVIVVHDGPGFYTSRVLAPFSVEAGYLLEEGASVEAIDTAITDWGFPVGPLLLGDEVGLDVAAHVAHIMRDAFGPRLTGPDIMEALVEDGRKGRKNGRGFYLYENGERGGVDDSVYEVMGLGERSTIPKDEIQERIVLAFINEAARCLEDGVLRSPRDGDIGAVFGVGYPPFRGGPFLTIDEMGMATVVERLEALEALHGERFAPAQILKDHAEAGETFRHRDWRKAADV
ncbi:MAG: fatty acid oxidation complex subunit alpha FadJ [Acidimicrobiia bacterium]|nr:fatty acid oxidation complex subunit alpha FadJ [Acidimicrobiia bacterium]